MGLTGEPPGQVVRSPVATDKKQESRSTGMSSFRLPDWLAECVPELLGSVPVPGPWPSSQVFSGSVGQLDSYVGGHRTRYSLYHTLPEKTG